MSNETNICIINLCAMSEPMMTVLVNHGWTEGNNDFVYATRLKAATTVDHIHFHVIFCY